MRTTTPLRRALITVTATAAVVLTATGTAVAVPVHGTAAAPHTAALALSPLHSVVGLAAERLATADLVAAAKWGTDSPIDDPAREQQVLDNVAAQAQQLGADPDEIRVIFRDQIEANKVVQRGLFQRWTDHPDQAPTTKPDLTVVRQEINRITSALVQALADTSENRGTVACRPELALAGLQVHQEDHLDALHTRALIRALPSVCRG
ncbi:MULTISPECIES: chorismate mutase [unclassified Streptomyces]|jgi:chorismate mutase|uniref:chorismate mutase n=1 Tax=unclassified Streptomyces TaxID=2593676 RepID=UPI001BAEB729|nr:MULTISPECIES: chorismate mutase [unclassified Streptomyces]MDH6453251.1 chorismate mutase [Streptomyces sp. SAI-119]MDH6496193.1 chorismate mutase [Streptomyces sp. SAI-149]QUC56973.1 chorismate mutase [Streptomyces sp. A2-16]